MLDELLSLRVLERVAGLCARAGWPGDELATQLRAAFPGVHFSVCNDDDVPARLKPAAGNRDCRIYYVDSRAHCLQLTDDPGAATGYLIAQLELDEEGA